MKKIRKGLYTSKDELTRIENVDGKWNWSTFNADDEKVTGTSETKKQAIYDANAAWWTKEMRELEQSIYNTE